MQKRYAVLIPAYNSQATILELIERLQALCTMLQIYVIDDGSIDKTKQIAQSFREVIVVSNQQNKGKGAAIKNGLKCIAGSKDSFAAVIFIDSDLQHIPEKIPEFIDAYEQGRGDFVVGKRALVLQKMPLARIVSNLITSAIVSSITGSKIYDSQCGFRLIDAKLLLSCASLESENYALETEILLKCAKMGCRFWHVDIPTIYADELSYINAFRDTLAFLEVILKNYRS